ncbi:hypothetical protein L6164_002540 [Bauhinia variegata]|uniref:Uncharacterized protein n=1 Tax=Bauhinia variegata TaxID=167791 RepID=A0ACB9PXZ1_BAUVA|nr:hypothetical protein L6164_002540 [Bauhinia variegata]
MSAPFPFTLSQSHIGTHSMASGCDWSEIKKGILERVNWWQQRNEPPLALVQELVKYLNSWNLSLPSPDLAELLVSHLCFDNNHPSMWKFIHQALSSRLLFPLQLLSLLSSRIIPHRRSQPEAYRLFLELLSQYAFSFDPSSVVSCKLKIIKSVNVALQLSQTYKIHALELGHVYVLFFYSIIVDLMDSTLEDWGFHVTSNEKPCSIPSDDHNIAIDTKSNRSEYHEQIRKRNSFMALEVLERLTESTKAMVLLKSALLNMPDKFSCLLQRLQFLESLELASSESKLARVLGKVSTNIRRVSHFDYCQYKHQLVGVLVGLGTCNTLLRSNYRSCQSPCWVSFDIYMENAMDAKQLPTKSAVDVLTEGIRTLQVFNQATWQETFLALWLSALRLVQRERHPSEGPIPHLDARLCVLLSIVPLAIANVLRDESEHNSCSVQVSMASGNGCQMNGKSDGSRKYGLISSVQMLGHFSSLLCPPTLIVDAANQAATKAASFICNSRNDESGSGTGIHANTLAKSDGNLWHLIVESCIVRNLMDKSVYLWPGYVCTSVISFSDSSPVEKSPWLTFLEGAPLNDSLISSLTVTPASSLTEIEKLHYIALNGSEEERHAAAKILCGASLNRGWYIQEHVVHYVVKLLGLPVPFSHSGSWSHLVDNMPLLSAILLGASSVDTVHILSLHGVVPTVAASLMPLCESFGSLKPTLSNSKLSRGEESSTYMAFSLAFLFLIRLWKFYRPPLDQCITEGGTVGSELTLEYLLSLHNNRIVSCQDELRSDGPIYLDSFPKLRAWYCQYKSCVASAISGLSTGNSVHQAADKILSMIYWKMTKSGLSSSNCSVSKSVSGSSSCGSCINAGEDVYERPMLPAWEVLEALPFVLEAILTACAHGRLSSRDLTTGLRDLVDFLPASLAAIIGYFSSEVTRGVWKLVPMNGVDWPSPSAILQSVESEIKAILAAVGVEVPNCSSGNSPAMLPLPMAALVSLTITFKLDKNLEYIHAVAGPALEKCASGCPWPSMPIIGSLWAQKIRRWHNFIVVSCSRSVFRHNKESMAQLLRSCFSSFLGTHSVSTPRLTNECSVNGLLGVTVASPDVCPPVAPGFLYLRSCRNIQDLQYVNEVIVGFVVEYSCELPARWASAESHRLKCSDASLSLATQRAKEAATLGASLLCVAGGIQLVKELYRETIPTWLLSSKDVKPDNESAVSGILEGYAMAYLLMLSGSIIWGVGTKLPPWAFSRRTRIVGVHLDFLADVMEGKISLSCNTTTWKTYVSSLVGLLVNLAPAWVQEVKLDTLRKLACGLSRWHEYELALSLLQRGGPAAIGAVGELINVIC